MRIVYLVIGALTLVVTLIIIFQNLITFPGQFQFLTIALNGLSWIPLLFGIFSGTIMTFCFLNFIRSSGGTSSDWDNESLSQDQ